MDTDNENNRLRFETQDRLTGEAVKDTSGTKKPASPGLVERAELEVALPSPLPQKKKELWLRLDRMEADAAAASAEDSVASGSASSGRVLHPRRGPKIVEMKKYPKEMRIRVVADEIVNSVADSGSASTSAPSGFGPVGNTGVAGFTLPASSDEGMVVDRAGSRSGSVSLESTSVEDYRELSSSFEQVS
ncbi:hypothetical protein G5I_11568 [Acromyrmex echinatior]|uniref:Uncharacterized protein n=1 Tax=Acromyrmex echinatior TaxID=103372 RepID=F4WZZ0_ACREC|nr:hypothetical protein G5I_11568 [Acromyrmex echinatior]